VTSLRRRVGQAGAWLGILGCLTWLLASADLFVLSTGALLVASAVGAAGLGAASAGTLRAAARLRTQGRITDATIVSLRERYFSSTDYSGWVTGVKVSFTDASGHPVNARYTDHARAGGKREGQMVQIVYDPRRPVSIAPAGGGDSRVFDGFLLALPAAVSAGMAVYFAVRAFG
jgi:hypothetical protein